MYYNQDDVYGISMNKLEWDFFWVMLTQSLCMCVTCFISVKHGPDFWLRIAPYTMMLLEIYKYIAVPIIQIVFII